MSCYHPIKAFDFGVKSNGKKDIRFSRNFDDKPVLREIEIPCGQCIGCRLDYSREWANRCMMELENQDYGYFVTLTYSDEWLNRDDQCGKTRRFYADKETGEAKVSLSLCKKDLQDFFKRLREDKNFCDSHIRYYACGEYGDSSKRPHYHVILYGIQIPDLKFYKTSGLKNNYYNSEILERIWKRGYVVVGDISWETCAYTARYVMKKVKGIGKDVYEVFNMEPEFVLMSRKPGIGRKYYEDHRSDFIDFGETWISGSRSIGVKAPRYFQKIMEQECPKKLEKLKEQNILCARLNNEAKLAMTDLSIKELREVEENARLISTKALKREM